MKYILPLVCSILLIGCGDSFQTPTSSGDTKIAETMGAETPVVTEASTPIAPPAVQEATPVEQSISQTVTPEPIAAPKKPETPARAKATLPDSVKSVETTAVDGKTLFAQKCASCHGSKAEKSALNKSQIIADFNEQQVKDALNGYQAGSYGKEMKGLMQGQVKSLIPDQINALAKYISTL